ATDQQEAGRRRATRLGDQSHLARGIELRNIPVMRAGEAERAGGRDAGPIEDLEREADGRVGIDAGGEGQLEGGAEGDGDAGGEGDARLPGVGVEDQLECAGGSHRQVVIDDYRQRGDWWAVRRSERVAVIVPYDQRLPGGKVKAGNVAVGANKVLCDRGGEVGQHQKLHAAEIGGGEVRASEVGAKEADEA